MRVERSKVERNRMMDVWVRNGRFLNPGICAFRTASAAKRVREKNKGWIGPKIFCSSNPEADDQPKLSLQHDGIMCELCNGSGWLICEFCRGQKTNVQSSSTSFYRRCPNCKAVGLTLCPKCKVFKCVIFPDFSDSLP